MNASFKDHLKSKVYGICSQHRNKPQSLVSLGEKVDTTRRCAVHRYALILQRKPSRDLIRSLHEPIGPFPPWGFSYSADINSIEVHVERIGVAQEGQAAQSPFNLPLHSEWEAISGREQSSASPTYQRKD